MSTLLTAAKLRSRFSSFLHELKLRYCGFPSARYANGTKGRKLLAMLKRRRHKSKTGELPEQETPGEDMGPITKKQADTAELQFWIERTWLLWGKNSRTVMLIAGLTIARYHQVCCLRSKPPQHKEQEYRPWRQCCCSCPKWLPNPRKDWRSGCARCHCLKPRRRHTACCSPRTKQRSPGILFGRRGGSLRSDQPQRGGGRRGRGSAQLEVAGSVPAVAPPGAPAVNDRQRPQIPRLELPPAVLHPRHSWAPTSSPGAGSSPSSRMGRLEAGSGWPRG